MQWCHIQVCFPQHGTQGADWLVSSSADGFINVMALGSDLDEEEAFRVRPFCTPDNCLQRSSAEPLPCRVLKLLSHGRVHLDMYLWASQGILAFLFAPQLCRLSG